MKIKLECIYNNLTQDYDISFTISEYFQSALIMPSWFFKTVQILKLEHIFLGRGYASK